MAEVALERNRRATVMDKTKQTIPDAPLAVSPAEGARLAGVGRTKFYEALSAGEVRSIKFGARRLVRVSEILAWLERLEAETAGQ